MSDIKLNEIKPFRQIPACEPETILSITGAEFQAIQNVLNVFKAPIEAIDSVFNRNLNEGNIVIKYIQEDGTEISKEEAFKYLEQAKDFLKEKENPLKAV